DLTKAGRPFSSRSPTIWNRKPSSNAWTRRSPNAGRHALTVHALDPRSGRAPLHPSHPSSNPPGILEPVLRPVSCRRTPVTVPHKDIGDISALKSSKLWKFSEPNPTRLPGSWTLALVRSLLRPWPGHSFVPGSVTPSPLVRSLLRIEVLLQQIGQGVDGLLGALALGAQRDLVALRGAQCHQHQHAGGLHGVATGLLDGHGRRLLLSGLGEDPSGTCVQAGLAGDGDGALCHGVFPFECRGSGGVDLVAETVG